MKQQQEQEQHQEQRPIRLNSSHLMVATVNVPVVSSVGSSWLTFNMEELAATSGTTW
jgi:hypothetical protein